MAATYTRRNVYDLGGDWGDPILWYARGVKAMQARALDDPLAWRFFGGIHGFDKNIWKQMGYLSASDRMPSQADLDQFWEQCQHQTWYFLPWHRGYLLALEATIRAEVIGLGGPADWALPYWNYFGPHDQYKLPPAFASPDWPDGTGDNPLYTTQRYGPKGDGNVYIPLNQVNLDALNDPDFTGVVGGDAGFGGLDTGFSHDGPTSGRLESQPHNRVHTRVGGQDARTTEPGLMSDPDTAGLDPIFYLHHANIDRLWEVWLQGSVSLGNPTQANYLGGPASVGERGFSMPMPPKGDAWDYTPAGMGDLSKLDYAYDDVSSPAVVPPVLLRRQRLGIAPAAFAPKEGIAAMATSKHRAELVGANQQALKISGTGDVHSAVRLNKDVQRKVRASFAAAAAPEQAPDRVFLNLENVRGSNDATTLNVYVNERLAGNVSFFGVRRASMPEHGGKGRTLVLEITNIVDDLHLQSGFDLDKLDIRIEPLTPVPESANVSIGRMSIFRQGR